MADEALQLFKIAEPLLRQKRPRGWTTDNTWEVLCERWLKDAGAPVPQLAIRTGPASKKDDAIRRQLSEMRKRCKPAVDMMANRPLHERRMLVPLITKLLSKHERRTLLESAGEDTPFQDVGGEDAVDDGGMSAGRMSANADAWESEVNTPHQPTRARPSVGL